MTFAASFHRRLLRVLLAATFVLGDVAPAIAQSADPHYTAGVAAFGAGDYAKAVTEMNASLAAQPTSKAALYLGNAHLKLGQLGPAKAALQRALTLDPANPKRETILTLIKGIDVAQTAKVKIVSTPPGATIYLESSTPSAARGRTPNELTLSPGRHEIIVTLDGYEPMKQVRTFKSAEKVTLDFDLKTRGCALALSAEPKGALASVDGGEPSALPMETRVAVGAHKVRFTAEAFEARELTADCDGSKPLSLAAKLTAVVASGRVKFPAAPGVAVSIDGRTLSAEEIASGVVLPVGQHEVVFTGKDRKPSTQTINVAASEEIAVEPPPTLPEAPPTANERPPAPTVTPAQRRSVGFPERGIYAGLIGGANLSLVEWNLGTDTRGAYPKSSATGGVRAGVQIWPRLAAEGEVQWVGLPNRLDNGLGQGLTAGANVVFHLLTGRWRPVLSAGAGSYQVLSSALRADTDLRVHAGVGIRGAIGELFVVRADARNVITDGFDDSIGNNLEVLLAIETYLWRTTQ
jgi:hypothetical protein